MVRVLRKRLNLGKVPPFLEIPNLIEIQKRVLRKISAEGCSSGKKGRIGTAGCVLECISHTGLQ